MASSPPPSGPSTTRSRRNLFPFVLVGLLGLLAAGAAIWSGLFLAPSTVDLAVHNAAGETLAASTVAGSYAASTLAGDTLHFSFHAPDRVTAYFSGPVKGVSHTPQTASGPTADRVLAPVQQLETLHGFRSDGSVYLLSESIKQLVAPAERSHVTGTIRAATTVATGYVVRIQEHIVGVETVDGRSERITDRLDYRLSRVDGWTAS